MSAIILDGKKLSKISEDLIKEKVEKLSLQDITPTLATILVGNDPASETYVKMKRNTCARVGMKSIAVELPDTTTTEELLSKIQELNNDKNGLAEIMYCALIYVVLDVRHTTGRTN